ncbi:MAG TPA: galactose-1-phosphate uridylyltransferase, partial [Vicinamibacterales bacterium]|nr:galactose-1-phosphate uridylyltransferase [Vicinamibacterales bacterium]
PGKGAGGTQAPLDNISRMWEERWHPLREEWVIVAAHRQSRPWSGAQVADPTARVPAFDPTCYLCPGNARVSGAVNPCYTGTFVFDNDHPCVGASAPRELAPPPGLYRNRPATGVARVVCYSPRHDETLAELDIVAVDALLQTWQQQMRELAAHPDVSSVLIFENKGEVTGVSNPHPHCQIYATNFTFKYIETELLAGRRHLEATGRTLFHDVLAAEQQDGRRIVSRSGSAIAFVPYFARYAYETYVAPLRSVPDIAALEDDERRDLAGVLRDLVIRFDNLWQMPFPYVMTLHQAPVRGDAAGFHFHLEFHPPLRRPNLLKYLAGPEIGGGNFLSDTSPEEKAAELVAAGGPHYRWAPA